jgi:RNA binding exosome subunit
MNRATSKSNLNKSIPHTSGSDHRMAARRSPFLSLDISAIAHATEDLEKVEQAVRFVTECLTGIRANVTKQYLKGHHGNVITTISVKLPRKQLSPDGLELLSRRLSDSDKRFLSDHMSSYVDPDRNLYLRFDKQEALLGRARLHESDPVRMKLKFSSTYDEEAVAAMCRENGLVL